MNLTSKLLLFAVPGLLALAPCSRSVGSTVARPPNVIFFATDDLNDWVEPQDSPSRAKTPHRDRLAARGVTFTSAHTAGIYCAPSRTALFTGRHPSTTGVYETQIYFREHPSIRPMQVALQEAGYSNRRDGMNKSCPRSGEPPNEKVGSPGANVTEPAGEVVHLLRVVRFRFGHDRVSKRLAGDPRRRTATMLPGHRDRRGEICGLNQGCGRRLSPHESEIALTARTNAFGATGYPA